MRDDVHALAGAYALGALVDEAERLAFEEHLARCEVCAEEVGGLLAASAVLSRAVALPPPPGLRDRVLAGIDQVSQSPPVPAEPGDTGPARRSAGRLIPLSAKRPRLIAAALVAACLAMAVGSGAVAVRSQQRLDRVTAADHAIAAVLSAPDARTATGTVPAGGTVNVVASPSRRQVVIASTGLLVLPASKTYELWTMSMAGARPAGFLHPDAAGHISPLVANVPAGTDRLGLTVEPAGGSPQPTTQPVLVLTI